jgi:hypothetical protein
MNNLFTAEESTTTVLCHVSFNDMNVTSHWSPSGSDRFPISIEGTSESRSWPVTEVIEYKMAASTSPHIDGLVPSNRVVFVRPVTDACVTTIDEPSSAFSSEQLITKLSLPVNEI